MNPSPTVDGKFAAKDVGGGVPDAPRRGQRLAAHNERRQFATQTRSCGCLPRRGKHCSHPGFAPLNRGPCSQPRNPSLRCKGYGVAMARWRAGHARPLRGGVDGVCTRGAREGGSPALFPLTGCRGRLRAAYMPPLQSTRLPLRGFGGTPDSKVEEGPMALRTDSNTAFA